MTPTILVAEDNDLVRHLLDQLLRSAGYQVLLAADGEQLLRLALAGRPDLVLTDLEMPLLDGIDAIRRLCADARTTALPLLAMSARDDSAGLALDAGADDFVVKPFAITWLLNLVAEHLRRVHTRQ